MALTILMACYTLLALGIGWYFYAHRRRAFLVFHPESSHELSRVLTISGVVMLLIGVLSAVATIMNNMVFISTMLLVGVIAIISIQLILLHWFPKA